MNPIDWAALGIIIILFICAVRYIIVSRKKNKCSGCCSCCTKHCESNIHSKS